MQRDVLRTMWESHQERAANESEGLRTFHEQFHELITEHEVTLQDVSVGNLFRVMCDPEHRMDKATPASVVAEAITAKGMQVLTGELLHPVFMKEYNYLTADVLELLEETTSSSEEETIPGLGGNDGLEMVPEMTSYPESQPTEKKARIVNYKFGRMISVSKEAVLFDKTGLIVSRARQIGRKGGTHLHYFAIQKVCDLACTITGEAAGTSLVLNGSAVALYSDDHSAADGYANDNLIGGALSHANLSAALVAMSKIVDDKGDKVLMSPRFLIVPVALQTSAQQLLGSMTDIDTAGKLAINVFKNRYKIVSSPVLDGASATAWYLGDPTMQTRIQWVWKPMTESYSGADIGFKNDVVMQNKISYMAGIGSTDYKFVVKSTGS